MRTCSINSFCQSPSADVVEASFEIAHMIAKQKKPHSIGETLIKPSILKAASLVLGEASSKKLAKISLSDSTIKTRIDEIAHDIELQVIEKIKLSPFFAIQCDETTDVANLCQLLVYVRFVGSSSIEEDMLLCKPLETTSKAEDVFKLVAEFFENNELKWDKLVGVCTDGAPAMIGSRSEFIARIKQKNSDVIGSHCVIHRDALASKTLSTSMKDKLAIIIRTVNYIKTSAVNTRMFAKFCKDMDCNYENLLFHTNVRWLSKGNMLARVYEMRNELTLFLEAQEKYDLLLYFKSDEFVLVMAYLVDIFESLNKLNLLLQGRETNRITDYGFIRAYIAKLELWYRRAQQGNAASFPNLDTALDEKQIKLDGDFKSDIVSHLRLLKEEFERYFPDLNDTELPEWKLTRDPFRVDEDILPSNLQEEFLDMKFDSSAKDDFEAMPLTDFWAKYVRIYKRVGSVAIRTLLPFSSTYLCESGFSTLVNIKTKQRNKLQCESDMRCALSATVPRIKLLVSQKQIHPSH
uniref:protein ZBED8-like n=1 Tax=Styela clava TaxID=7725 RepID=UPI001939B87D|nr:protein ZBED8-like [Styela clava]